MKIKSIRVKGFRTIEDTGRWELVDRIAALAGKNASGKSSIFDALLCLNRDAKVDLSREATIDRAPAPLNIALEMLYSTSELAAMKGLVHTLRIDNLPVDEDDNVTILVSKRIDVDGHVELKLNGKGIVDFMAFDLEIVNSWLLQDGNEDLGQIYLPVIDVTLSRTNLHLVREMVIDLEKDMERRLLWDDGLLPIAPSGDLETAISNITRFRYSSYMEDLLPIIKFFYFTRDDAFPDSIPYDQVRLVRNRFVKYLLRVVGFDLRKLEANKGDMQALGEMFSRRDKGLEHFIKDKMPTGIFLKLVLDVDALHFLLSDAGKLYFMSQRSAGEIWFLTLLLFMYRHVKAGRKPVVFLIDEPSNNLHPDAQKHVLALMDGFIEENPHVTILYSTHSPYLLEPDKLWRIARVVRTETKGTYIETTPRLSAFDSITPILTAIGDNLAAGIRPDRRNSIITEGYTDYLYLTTIKELMKDEWAGLIDESMYFIPSLGAGKMQYIGTILLAWGLDPVFLVDNDASGLDTLFKLRRELNVPEKRTIIYPVPNRRSIEDMFDESDLRMLLERAGVHDAGLPLDEGFGPYNGRYLEKHDARISKRLLALTFYDDPFPLNENSKKRFKLLFERIKEAIE